MWVEAGSRRAPSFSTELDWSCNTPTHCAASNPEAQTVVWATQLRLPLALNSNQLLWLLFLPSFLVFVFYCRWWWTAAGAHGGRGSSALEHVEVVWSSPIGSVRSPCLRMEGGTVRDRGFSTSPATRSPVMTVKVRISAMQVSKSNTWCCLWPVFCFCLK